MKGFKDEWDMLFMETLRNLVTLVSEKITVKEIYDVFVEDKKLISGGKKNNRWYLAIMKQVGNHPCIFWMHMQSISKITCDLLVGQVWLLKRKSQIYKSQHPWRYKCSCAIKIWYNQWLAVLNKQEGSILIHWISPFLSHICSILWNFHEATTQIPKTVL